MQTFELRGILEHMGKQPNKRLGQNFLIDQSVIHAALEAGSVTKDDVVLEVGPGLGVLTEALLNAGARVVTIEKDRAFAERLNSLHPEQNSRLRVISGDAAEIDWFSEIANNESRITNNDTWKFIANIPYTITSLLLRKALWSVHPPLKIVVLLQKEVGERCLGCFKKDGDRSLLSLMVGLSCTSGRIVRKVPPRCFFPPPKVDSAVLELLPMSNEERLAKWGIDPEKVMKIAKLGFAHPRKQLASNLGNSEWGVVSGIDKEKVAEILVSLGLNPKIRSEELSIQNWVDLTKMVNGNW